MGSPEAFLRQGIMTLLDVVLDFRKRENEPDPLKACWYLVAVHCSIAPSDFPWLTKTHRLLRWRVLVWVRRRIP